MHKKGRAVFVAHGEGTPDPRQFAATILGAWSRIDSTRRTVTHTYSARGLSDIRLLVLLLPPVPSRASSPSVAIPTGQRHQGRYFSISLEARPTKGRHLNGQPFDERDHNSKPRAISARSCQPPAQRRTRGCASVIWHPLCFQGFAGPSCKAKQSPEVPSVPRCLHSLLLHLATVKHIARGEHAGPREIGSTGPSG